MHQPVQQPVISLKDQLLVMRFCEVYPQRIAEVTIDAVRAARFGGSNALAAYYLSQKVENINGTLARMRAELQAMGKTTC